MAQTIRNSSLAARAAARNFRRNLEALRSNDAAIELTAERVFDFVFARDGSITTLNIAGEFHRGCTLPLRAAQAQLRTTRVTGQTACMLDPMHAAAVNALLGVLRHEQAVIAVVPDSDDAAALLHCGDFAAEISANRLHFVFGTDWSSQLDRLFDRRPGLAIPTHFVRTSDADVAATDALISTAQSVFGNATTRRNQRLNELRSAPPDCRATNEAAICVLGGQRFRLWNDAAANLLQTLGSAQCSTFDSDDPTRATSLALAMELRSSRAVVAADVFRSDCGAAVCEELPWITWLTKPRIAPPTSEKDSLIAADESLARDAIAAGWPKDRVQVGGWLDAQLPPPPKQAVPAIIANVRSLKPPKDLEELSSHRLLWEFIADQVARDPFCAFDRIDEMLNQSMKRQNVSSEAVPVVRFIDELILPATAVSVARFLAANKVQFTINGEGWQEFPDLDSHWIGPVQSRRELRNAVERAAALIHVVPSSRSHAIDGAGRPVVRYERDAKRFITACSSSEYRPKQLAHSINAEMIMRLI